MPIFIGDILQLTLKGECFGQQIILTHNYKCYAPPPTIDSVRDSLIAFYNGVMDDGGNDVRAKYLACLPTDYELQEGRAQVVYPVRLAYYFATELTPGTNAEAATVANDSAALTFQTASTGRSQVSTKHIGPMPDSESVAGLLTAGYKGVVATLGGAMKEPVSLMVGGALYKPVIFHRTTHTSDDIVGLRVGAQSRVQRRRTVGLGK